MPLPRLVLILLVIVVAGLGAAGWGAYRLLGFDRPGPMARAERAFQAGNLRAAQLDLRTVLRDRPDDAAAHLMMGEVQLRLSDPVAAEREADLAQGKGTGQAPQQFQATLLRGRALAAQAQLQKILDTVPDQGGTTAETLSALVLRAAAQIGLRRVDDAARTEAAAAALAPGSTEAALIAAAVAVTRGDADAEARVDETLRRDPAQLEALMMKQRLLAIRGDRPAALSVLNRALTIAPWSAAARFARAELLILDGQDADARADVNYLLTNQPRTPLAVYLHAVLLVRAADWQEAERALQAVAAFNAAIPRVDYYRAIVAAQQNRGQEAQDAATRYVRRAPTDPEGAMLLATIELGARRPEQALAALRALPDGGTGIARAMDLAGQAHAMLGQVAEASAAFARASTLSPADTGIASRAGLFEARTGSAQTGPALDRLAGLAAKDPAAEQVLVQAAITAGDVPRARTALASLRAQTGDTDTVGMLAGAIELVARDLPAAEKEWAAVVARTPGSAAARLQLGRVLVLQGRSAEAAATLAPILAQDPANLPTLAIYAPLLIRENRVADARAALETALARSPANPALALLLAETLLATGDPARAAELISALPPGAATPALQVALAQAQSGAGRPADAKATLDALARTAPGNPDIRFEQLRLATRSGDADTARAIRGEALRANPADLRFLFAEVAAAGDVPARLARAEALRAIPAHMPAAALLKGSVLAAAGRHPEALQAFLAEYRQTPTPDLLSRLFTEAFATGTADEMAPLLQARLAKDPGDLQALHLVAEIDLRARRYAAAVRTLETILARRRDDPAALNNVALAYQGLNDPRALPSAQMAFMLQPSGATADTLGWLLARGGQPARALPLLRSAAREQPDDLSVRYHLAATLADTGQQAEAQALLPALTADSARFDEKDAAASLAARLQPPR